MEPARDEKFRRQIRQAARSLAEAGNALKTGRRKPRRRRARRVIVVIAVAGAGAAAVLASKEELRKKAFGGEPTREPEGRDAPAPSEGPAPA